LYRPSPNPERAVGNAAAALKKEHDLGAVEVGYFADMVILEADPLKDISNTQKIDLVIYSGKSLKPTDLLKERGNSH
jgi:imidazolonepropionase-like amidohydrolase